MRTPGWYLNRLSLMSPMEVVSRIKAEGVKLYEKLFFKDFVPEVVLIDAPCKWYFGQEERENIRTYLVENGKWNSKKASELLDHKFSFFSLKGEQFGERICWHNDYKNNRKSPTGYSKYVDYRDFNLVGDFKYTWELNRHQHLIVLAKAYFIEGDERYYAEIREQILDWIEENPYMHGINWTSSLELAVRLISWSWVWHYLGDIDQEFKKKWLESIYKHCHFISKNISAYSSANNHLIGEVAGLFIASIVWPFREASKAWQESSFKVLVTEMDRQNYPDGVNKEQAISYQQFILDFFVLAGLLGDRNGVSFPKSYWERAEQMLNFMAAAMNSNGDFPRIGDADDGFAVYLSEEEHFNSFKSLLATGAALFQRGDLKSICGDFDEKSLWLLGMEGLEKFRILPNDDYHQKKEFEYGGYYILGSDNSVGREVKCMFDCGPLGYLGIAAHGHADALAFSLSLDGREMLVDPGTYNYQAPKDWRDYFKGTSAHNTIRVDELDQSEIGGNFMWLRKAKTHLIAWESNQVADRIVAEHDGYKRLKHPLIHRREMVYEKNAGKYQITDDIITNGNHQIEYYLHFSYMCTVKRIEDNILEVENSGSRLLLKLDPNFNYEILCGSSNPILGWESYSFDQKVETSTLRGITEVSGPTKFLSEIVVQ